MKITSTISGFLKNSFELPLRLFIRSSLIILTFTTTANAQWSTQSPVPTNLSISGIGAPYHPTGYLYQRMIIHLII